MTPAGYDHLRDGLAWADLGHRTTVLATGPEAARFIDGFATAAIKPLGPGAGVESFFTDARGWVIALAAVLRTDDGLIVDAEPGLGERLRDHLEHYHIRERVELVDASADWACLLIAGPEAAQWLTRQAGTVPETLFGHGEVSLGGVAAHLVRSDWWGEHGWLVRCREADHGRLVDWLGDQGLVKADALAVEAARTERGTPHPADIRDKTLPQELGRDARAISFTKGCYLGQEMVARLDALGHVNRRLMAVAVAGEVTAGAEVRQGDAPCGSLTTVCHSPRLGSMLGLGVVSMKAASGTITVGGMEARVVELPL